MTNSLSLKNISKKKDFLPILRNYIADAVDDYADFVEVIDTHLQRILNTMTRSANFFQKLEEDQITFQVISQLQCSGFGAHQDKDYGGHVDIAIELGDFIWLAEAKKHSSYIKLQKGWEQLTTRYSSGLQNEDHGGFIIYNFNNDALRVSNEWKEFLREYYPLTKFEETENELNFSTIIKHERSGRRYTVKHFNVPLHYDPKDRAIK